MTIRKAFARTPVVLSSRTMTEDAILNRTGEKIGRLKELMIDIGTGRVAYAILSFNGWLGQGERMFPVPWAALQINPEDKNFILAVPRERIEAAPGFEPEEWPDFGDRDWSLALHNYYGFAAYWEDGKK